MRILIVGIDCWNDSSNGNNVYSNWFTGFNAEFANIYLGPGIPENECCEKYFQITDKMMAQSLYSRRAGKCFRIPLIEMHAKATALSSVESEEVIYKKAKAFSGQILYLIRDILWSVGCINKKALKDFITDFNPDIIFCPHLYSVRVRRVERIIHSICDAPMVGFTGDAEASLNIISFNPLFWIRRIPLHWSYAKHIKLFKHYFTFSEKQCEEITKQYGVPSSTLYKCTECKPIENKEINSPLKIVYAGRLYCNRWKTISSIGDALAILNEDSVKAEVYVYSQDQLTAKQKDALSPGKFIHFMGATHPSNLPGIYQDADIALHVESFDKKNRLDTMYSLSTKIIDLMSSTCAILAICWDQNNGWNYLKRENAAICISKTEEILPTLQEIVSNPQIINDYAKKANDCGIRNHNKEHIQGQIRNVFMNIIVR